MIRGRRGRLRGEEEVMSVLYSAQYDMGCVRAVVGSDVELVMRSCVLRGAVRYVAGVEYCVQVRSTVGPRLWTESELRRVLSMSVQGEG